jgi:hypothetical protein
MRYLTPPQCCIKLLQWWLLASFLHGFIISRKSKTTNLAGIIQHLLATLLTKDNTESFINPDLGALPLFGLRVTSGKAKTVAESPPSRRCMPIFLHSPRARFLNWPFPKHSYSLTLPPTHSADFQPVDHHFLVQGPSGSHRFLIYPLAGPSILAMSDSPGRVAGSRRLRADLARKVAKQTATTLHHMHSVGVVH